MSRANGHDDIDLQLEEDIKSNVSILSKMFSEDFDERPCAASVNSGKDGQNQQENNELEEQDTVAVDHKKKRDTDHSEKDII